MLTRCTCSAASDADPAQHSTCTCAEHIAVYNSQHRYFCLCLPGHQCPRCAVAPLEPKALADAQWLSACTMEAPPVLVCTYSPSAGTNCVVAAICTSSRLLAAAATTCRGLHLAASGNDSNHCVGSMSTLLSCTRQSHSIHLFVTMSLQMLPMHTAPRQHIHQCDEQKLGPCLILSTFWTEVCWLPPFAGQWKGAGARHRHAGGDSCSCPYALG